MNAVRKKVSHELKMVKDCMCRLQEDHQFSQRQAPAVVTELQKSMQTMMAQQQMAEGGIAQGATQLQGSSQAQKSLSGNIGSLGNQQQNVKLEIDREQDDMRHIGHDQAMRSKLLIDAILENRKLASRDTADLKWQSQIEMENARAQFSLMKDRWSREKTPILSLPHWNFPMGDIPAASISVRRNPTGSTAIHAPIRKPPKFSIDRCVHWKEEIGLWMYAQIYLGDPDLIIEISLQSGENTVFRVVIMQFAKSTTGKKQGRSTIQLFDAMDTEFLRNLHEGALAKISIIQTFKRFATEDIFSFWVRFREMIHDLMGTGVALHPAMVFLRAIQALNLDDSQRMAALAALSSSSSPQCPSLLRQVTHRLLVQPLKIEHSNPAYMTTGDTVEDPSECFPAQKKTNKPGYELAEVQGDRRSVNPHNRPSDSSKGKGEFG